MQHIEYVAGSSPLISQSFFPPPSLPRITKMRTGPGFLLSVSDLIPQLPFSAFKTWSVFS